MTNLFNPKQFRHQQVSLDGQITEVMRELQLRERVYKYGDHHRDDSKNALHFRNMECVLETLEKLREQNGRQTAA